MHNEPADTQDSDSGKQEKESEIVDGSPKEVFQSMKKAVANDDWKSLCLCLSSEAQLQWLGTIVMTKVPPGSSPTEDARVALKKLNSLKARFGLGSQNADRQLRRQAFLMSENDRAEFLAGYLDIMLEHSNNPHPFGKKILSEKAELVDEPQIDGDQAQAKVNIPGQKSTPTVNFKNENGHWRISG